MTCEVIGYPHQREPSRFNATDHAFKSKLFTDFTPKSCYANPDLLQSHPLGGCQEHQTPIILASLPALVLFVASVVIFVQSARIRIKQPAKSKGGTFPCHYRRCQLCRHINRAAAITGRNGVTVHVRGIHNCHSTNVIYAITCTRCPGDIYIGQTGQSLHKRINGHKSDIRHKRMEKTVAAHFNKPGHGIGNLRVMVMFRVDKATARDRLAQEQKLISKLDTIMQGMNRDYRLTTHITE